MSNKHSSHLPIMSEVKNPYNLLNVHIFMPMMTEQDKIEK